MQNVCKACEHMHHAKQLKPDLSSAHSTSSETVEEWDKAFSSARLFGSDPNEAGSVRHAH